MDHEDSRWACPKCGSKDVEIALPLCVMFNYDRNNYTDAHWTEDELEWREA